MLRQRSSAPGHPDPRKRFFLAQDLSQPSSAEECCKTWIRLPLNSSFMVSFFLDKCSLYRIHGNPAASITIQVPTQKPHAAHSNLFILEYGIEQCRICFYSGRWWKRLPILLCEVFDSERIAPCKLPPEDLRKIAVIRALSQPKCAGNLLSLPWTEVYRGAGLQHSAGAALEPAD